MIIGKISLLLPDSFAKKNKYLACVTFFSRYNSDSNTQHVNL